MKALWAGGTGDEQRHGKDPRGFGLWVCQELASHLRGRFELDTSESSQTCLLFEVPNREAPEGQT